MDCAEFEMVADPLVDGELADAERREAESHLAGCAACHSQVTSLRALKRAVKRSAERRAPEALRQAVLARVAAESTRAARPTWQRMAAYAAAAAAGFALFAGGKYLVLSRGEPRAERLVIAAVNQYARGVPRDIETKDPARAVSWAQERVNFNPRLPQLGPQVGLQLVGAGVTSIEDRAAAAYEFEAPTGRRISLIVSREPELVLGSPTDRVGGRDVTLRRTRGYNVAMWREDEIVYQLVTDLDDEDVLGVLRQLRR